MPRATILLLCAVFALLGLPGAALAQVAADSDPAAALPDTLVTGPVTQGELSSMPAVAIDDERSGGLPETWCGTPTTSDDTIDDVAPADGPNFKLIYAYASDQPDRFAALADQLQASVSLLARYLAGQSGGAKTLRLDLGTSCGAEYADIQTVALPNPVTYYVSGGAPIFSRLAADVRAVVALPPGSRRNLLVYADALRGTDGVAGSGERVISGGDVPGAGNPHNAGGLLAVAWGPAAAPQAAPTSGSEQPARCSESYRFQCVSRYEPAGGAGLK